MGVPRILEIFQLNNLKYRFTCRNATARVYYARVRIDLRTPPLPFLLPANLRVSMQVIPIQVFESGLVAQHRIHTDIIALALSTTEQLLPASPKPHSTGSDLVCDSRTSEPTSTAAPRRPCLVEPKQSKNSSSGDISLWAVKSVRHPRERCERLCGARRQMGFAQVQHPNQSKRR